MSTSPDRIWTVIKNVALYLCRDGTWHPDPRRAVRLTQDEAVATARRTPGAVAVVPPAS
jgi:hypothetical protein